LNPSRRGEGCGRRRPVAWDLGFLLPSTSLSWKRQHEGAGASRMGEGLWTEYYFLQYIKNVANLVKLCIKSSNTHFGSEEYLLVQLDDGIFTLELL
jgi:hypothetical protein